MKALSGRCGYQTAGSHGRCVLQPSLQHQLQYLSYWAEDNAVLWGIARVFTDRETSEEAFL